MAFWSAAGPEPLRQYRWYITFVGSANLSEIQYALKKAEKPKAKVNTVQHKYMNHFFNYPGRLEWEDVNITFAAVSDPTNASRLLMNALQQAGYGVPGSAIGAQNMASIGKNKFATAIGTSFNLVQVDAQGDIIEQWMVHNPFFTSVQFGALDYGSEEIVEITCGVKYDWAELSLARPVTNENAPIRPVL